MNVRAYVHVQSEENNLFSNLLLKLAMQNIRFIIVDKVEERQAIIADYLK